MFCVVSLPPWQTLSDSEALESVGRGEGGGAKRRRSGRVLGDTCWDTVGTSQVPTVSQQTPALVPPLCPDEVRRRGTEPCPSHALPEPIANEHVAHPLLINPGLRIVRIQASIHERVTINRIHSHALVRRRPPTGGSTGYLTPPFDLTVASARDESTTAQHLGGPSIRGRHAARNAGDPGPTVRTYPRVNPPGNSTRQDSAGQGRRAPSVDSVFPNGDWCGLSARAFRDRRPRIRHAVEQNRPGRPVETRVRIFSHPGAAHRVSSHPAVAEGSLFPNSASGRSGSGSTGSGSAASGWLDRSTSVRARAPVPWVVNEGSG